MHLRGLHGSHGFSAVLLGFLILFVVLGLLESRFPEKRQRRFRRGFAVDTVWFFGDGLARALGEILALLAVVAVSRLVPVPALPWIQVQPAWLQVVEALVLGDLVQYWTHRRFHRQRLWRVHAVHHSIEELDWLAAGRVHPVETVLMRIVTLSPLVLLGFAHTKLLPLVALVLAVYPIFLHANVSWDFGPLRWVVASPAFHHWHHTAEADLFDRNFAGLFPFIDLLFGTYHLPSRQSSSYGLARGGPMRLNIVSELVYPFRAVS